MRSKSKMGTSVPFAFEVTFADGSSYRNRDEALRFSLRLRSRADLYEKCVLRH